MNIKHPEYIYLFLLIPALITFLYFIWQRREKVLSLLCIPGKLTSIFPKSSRSKTFLRYFLLVLTLSMFVTALVSPRWGYDWKEIETEGTNIIIALDVSKSMLAEDISPSRLSRAKFEINKLVSKLTGDRVGLIIFAGDAFLQSPLTHDYLMVKDWVSKISTNSVSTPGTSIRSAVETARKAFKHIENEETKTLIVMSDGEEHDEETLSIVRKASSEGIRIYTIGIGTAKGSPIQYSQGLVKDNNGNVVISKLDDSFLKEIAEAGDGHYVRSSGGDFHLDKLYYDYIKVKSGSEVLKSGKSKRWYETYQIFMSIALLALILEIFLSINLGVYDWMKAWFKDRKNIFSREGLTKLNKAQQGSKKKILACFTAFQLFSFSALPARANILDPRLWIADSKLQSDEYNDARQNYLKLQVEDPHNSRLNYNLGIAHYREGIYDQAVSAFTRAANETESSELKFKSNYNLGNSYFQMESYKEAIQAYEAALEIKPDDEDTKHNLELAKKKLQDQQQNKDQKKDDKNKQDQNQDPNKDDQDKDDKQDQNKDQQNKQDQNKPEDQKQDQQQNQNGLSDQDIERLLRQAQEADPSEVNQNKSKQKRSMPIRVLNPW